MYSRFKINSNTITNLKFDLSDTVKGKAITSNYKNGVSEVIKAKFKDYKYIDGTEIQEEWFPQVKSDIFLSHSHKDIEKAKKFAGWAKNKLNLDVFIDYNIWGNINDLLKQIDDTYCYNKTTKTYSYSKRNLTTSHVHMMLINALSDMIDRTECLIFFESNNSIDLKKLTQESTTESPWIYNELFLSKILRQKKAARNYNLTKAEESVKMFSDLNENFNPKYTTDISHLINLSNEDLSNWINIYNKTNKELHSLDLIYKLKKII
ncbi:hypothetical protein KUL156_43060 [Alteromonas sp. KUL156]|nr:hypothetical protein KUL154_18590 [Alteromonas sp. KUL154]GFE01714.1 hypothetical protein KUL156_43060 [Alteromonas sp. KUL156]